MVLLLPIYNCVLSSVALCSTPPFCFDGMRIGYFPLSVSSLIWHCTPSRKSCRLNSCPVFRTGEPFGVVLGEIGVDTVVQTRKECEEAAGSQHEGLRGGCMLGAADGCR